MSAQTLEALRRLKEGAEGTEGKDRGGDLSETMTQMLADVGTSLWRLRVRLLQSDADPPSEEMKRTLRHLGAAWDALHEGGLQVVDHTGEEIPEAGHYALKMVSFQPIEGISKEKVIETLKPTIRFREQIIQIGEVIVGMPTGGERQ
jgi:hypothetical protein